jgi:hypothetical protein
VVELVHFDRSKLGSELIDDEFVSFVHVIVVKDDGVTKVQGIREEIRDREDVSDLSFGVAVNVLTEEDGRLLEIGSLTRIVTEVLNDTMISRGLVHHSSSTEDEIVSKRREWMGGQSGPSVMPSKLEW